MVSLIIPTYNRLDLLKEALQSLCSQTYDDWEIVLADDGSTDGTLPWARQWLQNRRATLLELDHSGYPGLVRNRAVENSRGEWIAFLDSDDLWKPEKLARQIEEAEKHPHIRIWHCREIWQREQRIVSQKGQKHRRQGMIFPDALKKCIIGPSTVMIRRDLWEETSGFREDMQVAEDYELWLRICSTEEVGYLDEPLTVKRAGQWDQLSERYGQIEIFRIQGLLDLVEKRWFLSHGGESIQAEAQEELARKCSIYAKGCRKRGKNDEAEKYETLFSRFGREHSQGD